MKLLLHGVGTYRAGQSFGPAEWRHHDLLAIREGSVSFCTRRGSLELEAGDAVWIPPRTKFWGKGVGARDTMWVIHFRDPGLRVRDLAATFECGLGVFRGGILSDLALELTRRMEDLYGGGERWLPGADVFFAALLREISGYSSRRKNCSPAWIEDLESWARRELHRGPSVRDLAKRAGLSPSYFRAKFLGETGRSAGNFLRDLRLEEAARLLRESGLGLKEIGARAGYSGPVSFHRAFARKYRVTPANFRRELRAVL